MPRGRLRGCPPLRAVGRLLHGLSEALRSFLPPGVRGLGQPEWVSRAPDGARGPGLGLPDARGIRRVRPGDVRRVDTSPARERLAGIHHRGARPISHRCSGQPARGEHIQVLSVGSRARILMPPVMSWRSDEMVATATRGAVCFPRRVAELLRTGLELRDRYAAGEISRHGLAVARGRLEDQLAELIFPLKTNTANERLAQHLWNHRAELFTFLCQPRLDATNWRAELAIRFGVILRKVWGSSRTWAGARAQSVLMCVWGPGWATGR